MPKIINLLTNEFPEGDAHQALQLICKYGFDGHVQECLSLIRDKISNEKTEISSHGCIQFGALAASLLSGINEKIRILKKDLDSRTLSDLESVLGVVCKQAIIWIFSNVTSDKKKLILQISTALSDTCIIYKYDQLVVFRQSGLKDFIAMAATLGNGEVIQKPDARELISYYKWTGPENKKQDFIELFLDKQLILNNRKKNIHKLFEPGNEALGIPFNENNYHLLMSFFYFVKKRKLLQVQNHNGFYHPLMTHGLDFQKSILKNKSPREINDQLRKNKSEWTANSKKVEKWLDKFNH